MKHACTCKDCEKQREKELKHFNHPFYKEVDEFAEETREQQILKGAAKYPEPFNPDSWENDGLAIHAMQELRDGQVYVTGMRDRMRKQEAEIKRLKKELSIANEMVEKLTRGVKFWKDAANGK